MGSFKELLQCSGSTFPPQSLLEGQFYPPPIFASAFCQEEVLGFLCLYDVITHWGVPEIPGEGGPFGYLLCVFWNSFGND